MYSVFCVNDSIKTLLRLASLELHAHASRYPSTFLIVASEDYFSSCVNLIKSINFYADDWGIILVSLGFKPEIDLGRSALCIPIEYPVDVVEYSERRAFSANLRAPLLFELSMLSEYTNIFYADADSLITRNPTFLVHRLNQLGKRLCFRSYSKHLFVEGSGCLPFKSGGILCVGCKDSLTQAILKKYCSEVFSRWDTWFSDQYGLVSLALCGNFASSLLPYSKIINDWTCSFSSVLWSAKGTIDKSLGWILSVRLILFPSNVSGFFVARPGTKFVTAVLMRFLAFLLFRIFYSTPQLMLRIFFYTNALCNAFFNKVRF